MREETCSDCEFREDDIYCYSWSNAKIELEEIYEAVFGDNAINKYSHAELIERLFEMYDGHKVKLGKENKE